MTECIDDNAINRLFLAARSQNSWRDKPVPEAQLRRVYELMRWGPTSANCFPLRILFVTDAETKARLATHCFDANPPKVVAAPVAAILGYDRRFFEEMPRLFPHNPDIATMFAANGDLSEATAFRNSSLQGAYLMMAARSVGLDCGPISGFDNAGVDVEFFPDGRVVSNFICLMGHGDPAGVWPRLPRPEFDEVCRLI